MISTKKNLWLIPDKICIVRGSAVALNLMFEDKKDHITFLRMWDKYLGGMTKVINYHLTPTDWTILFKTKSTEEIISSYEAQRKRSKKAKKKSTLTDPKKMLSEHIRIFLSQYVRRSNQRHKRRGTRVLERFHKYIIKERADYKNIFALITNQIRFPTQENIRYQADETTYDIKKEIDLKGLLCVGNDAYRVIKGKLRIEDRVLKCMELLEPSNPILRNFFKTIKNNPHPPNSP